MEMEYVLDRMLYSTKMHSLLLFTQPIYISQLSPLVGMAGKLRSRQWNIGKREIPPFQAQSPNTL